MFYVVEYKNGVVLNGYFSSYEVCKDAADTLNFKCGYMIYTYYSRDEYYESL